MRAGLFKYGFLFTLLIASSCTSEEFSNEYPESRDILKISVRIPEIEKDADTRSEFQLNSNDDLVPVWAANDTLGIFPTKGDQVNFPLTSGSGGQSFVFDGGGWGLKDRYAYAAYFPFSKANYFRTNKTILLDYTGQVQNGVDNTAHMGAYDFLASGLSNPVNDYLNLELNRLECIVRLYLTVPATGEYTEAVIYTDDESFVTKQKLDISGNTPQTTNIDYSKKIVLGLTNFKTTSANQEVKLFIMAAPVNLSGKTLKVFLRGKNGNNYRGTLTAQKDQILKANVVRKFTSTLVLSDGTDEPEEDSNEPGGDTQSHRLQSVSVIPTTYINGMATITLTSLAYTPQIYRVNANHAWGQDMHTTHPILDHTNLSGAQTLYLSSEKNFAYYIVNPNGIRTQDIKLPIFESITSSSVTRANPTIKENSPIAPTAYSIDKNVLSVQFKKTVTTPITTSTSGNMEYFTSVSLKVPIADENLLPSEAEAFVNSDFVRVQEQFMVPYIAHAKQRWNMVTGAFADEVQSSTNSQIGSDGLFVHYHDSVCIYNSPVNRYVDIKAPYNQPLDLKQWVTVCVTNEDATDHRGHENLSNYADYGLGFRFYLARAAYKISSGSDGSTTTNQQLFANVTTNGIVTSDVYTTSSVIGREPIIRVELWDEVNKKLIGIRYLKIKWVEA